MALATAVTSNLSAVGVDTPLLYSPHALPKLFTLALAVALSALLLALSLVEEPSVRWHRSVWAVVALCVWAAVATAASPQPALAFFGSYDRLDGFLTLLVHAACFVLAVQLVRPRWLRPAAAVLVAAGVFSAVFGLLQVTGFDPFTWPVERAAHPIGFQGNRDFLGGLLMMPLVLAPFLAVTARTVRERVLWWLASGVIAACVVLTLVRGAWIAAAVGLAVALVVLWRSDAGLRPVDWLSMGAMALTVVLVAVFAGPGWGMEFGVLERIASITQLDSGSIATRFNSWEVALRTVGWRPLTGTGPDNFALAWTRFATPADLLVDPGGAVADNAHSYPLNLAATLGIPGLLAALSAIVLSVGSAPAAAKSTSGPATALALGTDARTLRRGLVVAAMTYALFLLSGFNTIETMAMWWVVLGMLAGTAAAASSKRLHLAGTVAVWGFALVALSLFTVAAVWVSADRMVARDGMNQGRAAALHGLERAELRAPWVGRYRLSRAELLAGVAQEQVAAARMQPDPARLQSALAAVTYADEAYAYTARSTPSEYVVYLMWSRMLRAGGTVLGQDIAQRAYDVASKAIELHPTSVEVRVHKAQAAMILGRPQEAAAVLERAWAWSAVQDGPGVLYVKALAAFDKPAAREAAVLVGRRFPQSEALATVVRSLETSTQ